MDEEDRRIETHPDLVDPNWQKHAELDAWLGAKKELKKKRRKQRKAGAAAGGYREPGASRWPGIAAIVGLIVLVVAAVTVNAVQTRGVNETPWFPYDESQITRLVTES
ncbi:hypothetical protein [Amycolatopsis regifaucium]|uniref:Uncharacterized protein n=1 Tax=Amycolatopsis regifaucium TaxID=546365 RepID=A0A154MHB9_9PSEU|nr:hypothetical protein [Amycolatopsis regifaucium]KZB83553.1 hypothetical protein AVL48_36295 [Amycolatopsis regifaucium]OKA03323.1 hypothetical protein ATP06_0236530 [Amycolatopsis regifaucium]SFJ61437.1 hypothetical protein SAMN04489731_12713 [Amycolatopsis regifaucium]